MSFELYIEPGRPSRNRINGQYLKGNVPANKGRSWDEWASKEGQERMKQGWKNLTKPHKRPDNQRLARSVVAIVKGKVRYFASVTKAAVWCQGTKGGVARCCTDNFNPKPDMRNGNINTDHTYMGYRWYYESDVQWMDKVR